ncbi:MAG: PQQ-dependent sugar dehydrogenase [Pseudonocardiaceae bacterium]
MPRLPVFLALLGLLTGCSFAGQGAPIGAGVPAQGTGESPAARPAAPAVPETRVEVVTEGLEHAWDIGFLPTGGALITERPARLSLLASTEPGTRAVPIAADLGDVYVAGEGGLMGLVVHPDFAQTRRFTTCQTHREGGRPLDVRLITWELSADGARASRVADPLVGGLPLNPSGRHSGCRPTIGEDGYLYVGTGDSARAAVSQDRTQLGGKVLRIDLRTGGPAAGNPFAGSRNAAERLVFTYGNRNVQGVTVQPGTGRLFAAEHGPTVDDEINVLRAGANYGWDPSRGGTRNNYDESVPMTDLQRFPSAVPAVWSSGGDTEAICGTAFLTGEQWGGMQGLLAVAALRGAKLLLMRVDADGTVTEVGQLPQLDGSYGRLRAARSGPDGAVYVTTSNGDNDKVLRITPR